MAVMRIADIKQFIGKDIEFKLRNRKPVYRGRIMQTRHQEVHVALVPTGYCWLARKNNEMWASVSRFIDVKEVEMVKDEGK